MTIVRFTLRIPIDLNKWLIEQAAKHNRSKHQEVVNILKLTKARSEAMGEYGEDEKWLALVGDKRE